MRNLFRRFFRGKIKKENNQDVEVLVPKDEEFERCVICGELTAVPVSMPIEWREDYEPGIGQLCIECKIGMRRNTEIENTVIHAQISKPLVEKHD